MVKKWFGTTELKHCLCIVIRQTIFQGHLSAFGIKALASNTQLSDNNYLRLAYKITWYFHEIASYFTKGECY